MHHEKSRRIARTTYVASVPSRPSRVVCSSTSSSSSSTGTGGLGLLLSSKPLRGVRGAGGCQHPTKPKPLRATVASPADVLVELVVTDPLGHPSCLLPTACPLSEELLELLHLDRLSAQTLAPTLALLASYLSGASPAEAAALRDWPAFIAVLERGLELACERRMGPSVPVLLLRLLSLLRLDSDVPLRAGYEHFYRLLANALEDATKRDAASLTPEAVLCAYEAWARIDLDAAPLKATSFGLRVRELIKSSAFSPEESAGLFCATSALLRRGRSGYNPNSYDVNALVGRLAANLGSLGGGTLEEVAWACSAFPWPTYQAPVGLLDRLAEEGICRMERQVVRRSLGNALLNTTVRSAYLLRPRLGRDLEARIAVWAQHAAPSCGCGCDCPGVWDCVGRGCPPPRWGAVRGRALELAAA